MSNEKDSRYIIEIKSKNEKEISKEKNMSNENKADMIYINEKTLPNEQKIDFEGEKNNTIFACACSGCSIL